MKRQNSAIVYSTETGRHCRHCGRPQGQCTCKKGKPKGSLGQPSDGIIRIRREVKGRKGKCVTVLTGFDTRQVDLRQMAAKLKRRCGTGGSVKDGLIIIQGDHRRMLQAELVKEGFKAKLAGG